MAPRMTTTTSIITLESRVILPPSTSLPSPETTESVPDRGVRLCGYEREQGHDGDQDYHDAKDAGQRGRDGPHGIGKIGRRGRGGCGRGTEHDVGVAPVIRATGIAVNRWATGRRDGLKFHL